MIYYISDLHLDDERVFGLCHRPFSSLKDMENELILKWNKKVKDEDEVYVLGDLSLKFNQSVCEFFNKTNGIKHLIVGNHDEDNLSEIINAKVFKNISHIKYIDDGDKRVCLCHYPIMDWQSGDRTIHHIYGHIHNKNKENGGDMYGKMKDFYKNLPAYNASVDVIEFEPKTIDELIKIKEE